MTWDMGVMVAWRAAGLADAWGCLPMMGSCPGGAEQGHSGCCQRRAGKQRFLSTPLMCSSTPGIPEDNRPLFPDTVCLRGGLPVPQHQTPAAGCASQGASSH